MKTIVITGGTKGIGKAIAEKFLENGYALATCSRTEEDLIKLKEIWGFKYPERPILTMVADIAKTEDVKAFGQKILQYFPDGIDILVNNAGLFLPGNLTDEPEGQLESLMQVHVFGAYHLTRSLLPSMLKNCSGHIFNMCSVAALHAYPNGGAYSVAKYALLGISENLRYELQDKGIKVTAVLPGAVWTNSWKNSGISEERIMAVSDIADMIWATANLSPRATVDNLVIRPQQGDL